MAIVKTEAVILKCENYRQTSKIITCYTKEFGKIKAIAKGVRDTKTKWGGALQPMTFVLLILYYKKSGNLHLVSNAEHYQVIENMSIYDDFDKMNVGFKIIDLINISTPLEQKNTEIFKILIDSLKILNHATKNYYNVLLQFELKLLKLLGFKLDLQNFTSQRIDNLSRNKYFYSFDFSNGDIKILEAMESDNVKLILSIKILNSQQKKFENFFNSYFSHHIEGFTFSKINKVIESANYLTKN
jgi:DNA repair protein RecO